MTTVHLRVGKVNCANLSRYSEFLERTYRRQFEQVFAFMGINRSLIEAAVAAVQFQVAALMRRLFRKAENTPGP